MKVSKETIVFIQNLIKLTNNKKVNWSKRDDDLFILYHSDYKISIFKWFDPDMESSICTFGFTKGDVSYSLNTTMEEGGFEELELLHDAASRNAQDIKGEMDDFLNEFK